MIYISVFTLVQILNDTEIYLVISSIHKHSERSLDRFAGVYQVGGSDFV